MDSFLFLIGLIIFICIISNKYLEKLTLPSLIFFILLGMVFGENGLFKIPFSDYNLVSNICEIALILIMFYGGFGTNLKAAKPVLVKAVSLSTLGVIFTTLIMTFLTHYLLKLGLLESFLISSVISSTDAASVFSILKSKKLALKNHTDSLLEVESGSNDPASFMLTILAISLMSGEKLNLGLMLLLQIPISIAIGLLIGYIAVKLLQGKILMDSESHTVLLVAVMILAYTLPILIDGNGYLSVYIAGIFIGNSKLKEKKYLVHFYDVLTHVAQVIIFFLLGLLVTPLELPEVLVVALILISLLSLVARPLAVLLILLPQKASLNQIILVSLAGLRGAASICFAILVVVSGIKTSYNLYNLIFCMVLISISVEGSLLPVFAKKLKMIDEEKDIKHTFTDYEEDGDVSFIKITLDENHPWTKYDLKTLNLPKDLTIALIIRANKKLIPIGTTVLEPLDELIIAAKTFENDQNLVLKEIVLDQKYANKTLESYSNLLDERIILIRRKGENLIPSGNTILKKDDILVLAES